MLTTDGRTRATRVATSGVPGRTGAAVKGAGIGCAVSGGEAAEAECWQPVSKRSRMVAMGMSFAKDMVALITTPRHNDSRRKSWRLRSRIVVGNEHHLAEASFFIGGSLSLGRDGHGLGLQVYEPPSRFAIRLDGNVAPQRD